MNMAETSSTVGRDVDVRGFSYALEPVRQKQQWLLDKLMADLANAQRDLTRVQMKIDELRQLHDVQAATLFHAMQQRLDPSAHRGAVGYLARLREQSSQLQREHLALLETCDSLRAACVSQQLRIEGLMRHKEDALREYAHEMRQRSDAEQDRNWLARRATGTGREGRAQ